MVVGLSLLWQTSEQKNSKKELAFATARAFFQQVVTARSWNAGHGGVYVPITQKTQPNQYLEDPLRDILADNNLRLTKINPAFMTRQISEISAHNQNSIQFHITSLKPLNPGNKPTELEKEWLQSFELGKKESGAFYSENSRPLFRYMAPLLVNKGCLPCHAKQGYKEGEIRGGVSVILPHFSQKIDNGLIIAHGIAALLGILLIGFGGRELDKKTTTILETNQSLRAEIEQRQITLDELHRANEQVKQLTGIIPICSHCKVIRDDKGYWNKLENFIEMHSEAQFSHSICEDCLDKYYPDIGYDE